MSKLPSPEAYATRASDPAGHTSPRLAVSLPNGGGAIGRLGEKATHDLATGAARFSIPIFTSPTRAGAEPKLSLSYDAASGNGAFGLGYQLDLAAVTRRTDRGVPLYDDDADTFLLSGEELVAVEARDGGRIVRYQPRREGAFLRIERIRLVQRSRMAIRIERLHSAEASEHRTSPRE